MVVCIPKSEVSSSRAACVLFFKIRFSMFLAVCFDIQDLLRRMLKLDPNERASIPEIFNHGWLRFRNVTSLDNQVNKSKAKFRPSASFSANLRLQQHAHLHHTFHTHRAYSIPLLLPVQQTKPCLMVCLRNLSGGNTWAGDVTSTPIFRFQDLFDQTTRLSAPLHHTPTPLSLSPLDWPQKFQHFPLVDDRLPRKHSNLDSGPASDPKRPQSYPGPARQLDGTRGRSLLLLDVVGVFSHEFVPSI